VIPLQLGGAFGLVGTLLLLVIAYFVGKYVYNDAKGRNMNETLWGVGAGVAIFVGLVPGLVVLLVYYVVRD
jgi:O-antigen ligase